MSTNDHSQGHNDLHFTFIEMLFALAVAEVAIKTADAVDKINVSSNSLWYYSPTFTHLGLATIVIAASWVGWGQSLYSRSEIRSIFSRDFLELLVDVFLVVCYFIVSHGVECPAGDGTLVPSAETESFWIMIIMATYVVWDVLSKWGEWACMALRGWASLVCAGIAFFLWVYLPRTSDPIAVVLCDVALLGLVLLFRAMKRNSLNMLNRRDLSWIFAFCAVTAVCTILAIKYSQVTHLLGL